MRRRVCVMMVALALVAGACGGDDDDATGDENPADVSDGGEDATTADDATDPPAGEEPTADVTEPIEEPTEEPTEAPTEEPTEAPTEAPTEEIVAAAWEEVAGGDECACADGSDWSFWVREADPTKVVLYFQGGGACFSAETCSFTDGTYKVTGGSTDDPTGGRGILDFANPANPFADWSWVFVPYCTGDVHIGDNTQDYGNGLVVEHNGFVNGSRALDELVARFGGATEVFVTGSSAGGVPAPLFAGLAGDRLPDARITALADASGAYPDVDGVNAAIGALWGSFSVVPDWPTTAGLTPADWSIPGLFTQAGLHNPDLALARYDNAFDEVQAGFANLAGVGADELVTLIDANEVAIEAAGVEVDSYVAPGTGHTILLADDLYTLTVEGVAFLDWLTALAEGAPVDDVHCTSCT